MSQDLKDILVASCYVHAASAHSSSSNSTFQSQIQTLHSLCARRRQVLTVSANGVIQPHAFQSHGAGVNGAGAARGGPGGRPMRQAITAHFDPQTNSSCPDGCPQWPPASNQSNRSRHRIKASRSNCRAG